MALRKLLSGLNYAVGHQLAAFNTVYGEDLSALSEEGFFLLVKWKGEDKKFFLSGDQFGAVNGEKILTKASSWYVHT